MLWFFIFTVLSGPSADACKCDFRHVKALYKNPVLAETAFVGIAEGSGKNRSFKVIQSWTPFQPIFKSPENSKCGLKTEAGKTYLVYSLLPSEEIVKGDRGFTVCDSYAAEINDAEPIIEKLAAKKNDNYLNPNPTWFYCVDHENCVTEKGVCSDTVAVNKRFRERFLRWAGESAKTVNCISSPVISSSKVKCASHFCAVESTPNQREKLASPLGK